MRTAPHFCVVPGCAVVTVKRRCRAHAVDLEHTRPNYHQRRWYRTTAWKALRAEVLRESAYQCAGCGAVVATLEVDHIRKHGGDKALFWNRANLQALCRTCHQRKTARGE